METMEGKIRNTLTVVLTVVLIAGLASLLHICNGQTLPDDEYDCPTYVGGDMYCRDGVRWCALPSSGMGVSYPVSCDYYSGCTVFDCGKLSCRKLVEPPGELHCKGYDNCHTGVAGIVKDAADAVSCDQCIAGYALRATDPFGMYPQCTLDEDECLVENGGCYHHAICVNTVGSYYCGCDAGYTLNADGFSCSVWPEVRSFTATPERHLKVGEGVTFTVEYRGDWTEFTFDFGDSQTAVVVKDPPDPLSWTSFHMEHVYTGSVLGSLVPTVSWAHKTYQWQGEVQLQGSPVTVEQPPDGLAVFPSSYLVQEGETVTFTAYTARGNNLAYLLDYGDGHFGMNSISGVFQHRYDRAGKFKMTLMAHNHVSHKAEGFDTPIVVVKPMQMVEWHSDQPVGIPVGKIEYVVETADSSLPGSHAPHLDFSFGDSSSAVITTANNLTNHLPYSQAHAFTMAEVGGVTSDVTASGTFGSHGLSMEIGIEEIISGLSLSVVPPIYDLHTGSSQIVFNVSLENGSHVHFTLDYGDGTSENFEHAMMFSSAYPLYITHDYAEPGQYDPVLLAENQVSSQNATLSRKLNVATEIRHLDLIFPPSIQYPPGIIQLGVTPAYGYNPPTGVTCFWRFNSMAMNSSDATALSAMVTYYQSFHLSRDHVGIVYIRVNCSNAVSFVILEGEATLVEDVGEPNITVSTNHIAVGAELIAHLSLDDGSDVTADIDFGDGNTTTIVFPQVVASAEPLIVSHTYMEENNYTLDAMVYNQYSRADATLSQKVVVQQPIHNLTAEAVDVVNALDGHIKFIVRLDEPIILTNVFLDWHFPEDTSELSFVPILSKSTSFYKSYDFHAGFIGRHPLAINAYNMVSKETLVADFEVQETIQIDTIVVEKNKLAVGQPVRLFIALTQGSNVNFALDFGDNTTPKISHQEMRKAVESQNLSKNVDVRAFQISENVTITADVDPTSFGTCYREWIGRVTQLAVEHTYVLPGRYQITVTVHDGLGAVVTTMNAAVFVEEALHDGLTVHVPDSVFQTPGELNITFELSRLPIPTGVNCDIHCITVGGSQSLMMVFLNVTKDHPQIAPVSLPGGIIGDVVLNISCVNVVSLSVFTKHIHVHEVLQEVVLATSNSHIGIGVEVVFQLHVPKGSNVTADIVYQDGEKDTALVHDRQRMLQFFHVFHDEGVYNVAVFCSNRFSAAENYTTVNVHLYLNETVLSIGGDVYIAVLFHGEGTGIVYLAHGANQIIGYDTNTTWSVDVDGVTLTDVTVRGVERQLHCRERAQFAISVTSVNPISQGLTNGIVQCVEQIVDVILRVRSPGYYATFDRALSRATVPSGIPVTFTVATSWGSHLKYQWITAENETLLQSTSNDFTHSFSGDNNHGLTLVVSNYVGSSQSLIDVRTMDVVNIDSLSPTGYLIAGEPVKYVLKLTSYGTLPCYQFDSGDGTVFYYGGGCGAISPHKVDVEHFGLSMTFIYTYATSGRYMFTIKGWNDVSMNMETLELTVNSEPCSPPEISIQGIGKSATDPRIEYMSSVIRVTTFTIISCYLTNQVDFIWWERKRQTLQLILLSDTSEIIFPEQFFSPGRHEIVLHASMENTFGSHSEDSVFFEIIETPLVVELEVGEARNAGWNNTLVMDAWSLSYDPDVTPDMSRSDISFVWYCKYATGSDRTATNFSPTNTTIGVDTLITEDNSRCFSDALKVSNTKPGLLYMNTAHMQLDVAYSIRVVASKGSRSGSDSQNVMIVTGSPPSVQIRCIRNCRSKVNTEESMALEAVCSYCAEGGVLEYAWVLYMYDWDLHKYHPVDDILSASVDTDGQTLLVPVGTVTDGQKYRLRAYIRHNDRGYSEYEFSTNLPPYGGHCSIEPPSEYGISTDFTVMCSNWTDEGDVTRREDPGDVTSVQLTYSVIRADSEVDVYLMESMTSSVGPLVLPAGERRDNYQMHLVVLITDKYGSNARSDIMVTVRAHDDSLGLLAEYTDVHKQVKVSRLDEVLGAENVDLSSSRLYALSVEAHQVEMDVRQERRLTAEDKLDKLAVINKVQNTISEAFANTAQFVTTYDEAQKLLSVINDKPAKDPSFHYQDHVLSTIETVADAIINMAGINREATLRIGHAVLTSLSTIVGHVTHDAASTKLEWLTQNEIELAVKETFDDPFAIKSPKQVEEILLEQQSTAYKKRKLEWEKAKNLINRTDHVIAKLSQHVGTSQLNDEQPPHFKTSELQVVVEVTTSNKLAGKTHSLTGIGDITLGGHISVDGSEGQRVTFITVGYNKNPFIYDESADFITTPVIRASFRDEADGNLGVRARSNDPVMSVQLPADFPLSEPQWIDHAPNATMTFHMVNLTQDGSNLFVNLDSSNDSLVYKLFIRHETRPSLDMFDMMGTIPPGESGLILSLGNTSFSRGVYYVGISQHTMYGTLELPLQPYILHLFEFDCRVYEDLAQSWVKGDCLVDAKKLLPHSAEKRHRRAVELPTYASSMMTETGSVRTVGGGLIIPPNTIDFKEVFSDLGRKFLHSPVVLSVIVGIIIFYVPILLWARRQDKKDQLYWRTFEASGNSVADCFAYKLYIHTGLRPGSGTKSNVFIDITGDDGKSEARKLNSEEHNGFGIGTIHTYLLTCPSSLGRLQYVHVWHDNSGKRRNSSWYLSEIVIEDIATKQLYVFICNDWLTTDDGDGKTERLISAAAQQSVKEFNYLFGSWWRGKIFESHTWLSIWHRPSKSNFTRAQRLSVYTTALFMTMVANAMWYREDVDGSDSDMSITLGPFIITYYQVYASVMSCLTVMPIMLVLKQVFVYTDPTTLTFREALKDLKDYSRRNMVNRSTHTYTEQPIHAHMRCSDDFNVEHVWQKTKSRKFPYVCIYVGWVLCAVSCGIAGFFTVMYSLYWGGDKANRWLSSFFLSVAEDGFIFSFGQVFLLAIVFAYLSRVPDNTDEDIEIEEWKRRSRRRTTWMDIMDDFTALRHALRTASSSSVDRPNPYKGATRIEDSNSIRSAGSEIADSNKILKEQAQIYHFLSIFFLRLLFVTALVFASWGHVSDDSGYLSNKAMRDMLTPEQLTDKSGPNAVWDWAEDTLIPGLYAGNWYNGKVATWRDRRYLSDRQSFRVGPARLRQLRINPASCNLVDSLKTVVLECNPEYTTATEDKRNYSPGWYIGDQWNLTDGSAFVYNSQDSLGGWTLHGQFSSYTDSGYVAELPEERDQALETIRLLKDNDWLTLYTRAVIVEFTVYNANENLFNDVLVLFETPATGGGLVTFFINTFRVYSSVRSLAKVSMISQLVSLLLFLYFSVGTIVQIAKQKARCMYFREPSHWLEIFHLLLGLVLIALFICEVFFTKRAVNNAFRAKGEFVSFYHLAMVSYNFVAVLGLFTFLNFVFLLRVLQTSHRFRTLGEILTHRSFEFFAFFIQLGILHMAFSSFYYVYLGMLRYEYSTFMKSAGSMTALLLGGGENFKVGVAAGDDCLSRLGVGVYGFIMLTVMMNIFSAMLVSIIEKVNKELKAFSEERVLKQFDPIDYFMSSIHTITRDMKSWAVEMKMLFDERKGKLILKKK